MPEERLQKVLARAGVASRRKAEVLIEQGRVSVDGRAVTELGVKVDARKQRIEVNGKRVEPERLVYVLFHKPRGVMCTMRDPEGRQTVVDYLSGIPARVVPVGRLDFHTSGVLLLTNDGEFAAAVLHPRRKTEKVYVAKVRGLVDDAALERWRRSIPIGSSKTQPANVRLLRHEDGKSWIEITLREGKNRQIHRLGETVGNPVLRLARISFAGINHEGLRPGQWRYLSKEELLALKKQHGVPRRIHPAPPLPTQKTVRKERHADSGPRRKGVAGGLPRTNRSNDRQGKSAKRPRKR